ncbi:hypothetical protein [Chlorobaculum sp. 24CR]|uniref:hypothetical protein n=1 Tax=Chlorobaculum sp. 24CR TaxID=2508878 RepID=UPI001ADC66CE|nr:hypothetical protein [Chlorobaculum sp. 24CR]
MSKTKITVATVGHMPADFNRKKVKEWRSSVFEIIDGIESYTIPCNSDGNSWEFTDITLERVLPSRFNGEFLIAIVNVPIEHNWYSRRLSSNRVVVSFHEIKEILRFSNIPLENLIYRLLYAYTLAYKRSGNRIPENKEISDFTHDETRGCLFDMNGIKTDVIYSCHSPIICSDCVERLRKERVSEETINLCLNEIQRIRKALFYRITDFIKKHPLWSLTISGITTIVLGVIGSLIGSYVFEAIK